MGRGRCNCGSGSGDVNFSNAGNVDLTGDGSVPNPFVLDIDFVQLIADLGAVLTGSQCGSTQVVGVSGGTLRLINLPPARCKRFV